MNEEYEKRWYAGMFSTEDWWAFWLGMFFVMLGIIASLTHIDLVGWIVKFSKWVDISKAFKASHSEVMSPAVSLITTYLILLITTTVGAATMRWNLRKYVSAFTIVFWITVISYIVGQNAYIAATEFDRPKYGIDWSLSLGGAFYIIALVVGLIIGNLAPKGFREFIKEGAKPEWFIKVAIVMLGAKLGYLAIKSFGFAMHLLIAGASATVAAYLLFWPLAYTISRRLFKLSREWSACFASGISICGVSAAIATAGAIKARPIVPVMVSVLVVVFALIELIVLPGILVTFWFHEPIAAGASLGLTVKTDGADAAAGAILDELMRSRAALELGEQWEEGWILAAAVNTKIWIDMFIGFWAFILAVIWVYYFERRSGEKVQKMEIWWRFPKFVMGYFLAMLFVLYIGLNMFPDVDTAYKSMTFGIKPVEGALRKLFFMLTFTSIGIVTDFRLLKKEGLTKLAVCYAFVLIAIIIPLGWFIAWLYHMGMQPVVKP